MSAWESVLAAELSARHHVTTRKRLQRLGISRRVIDGLCRRGRLDHVGNGVLVSPSGAESFEQHLAIACSRLVAGVDRGHGTDDLPRCDVVCRRDGIVVTSPPRTTLDAAAWLDANDLESVIEQGIARNNYTVPTLWLHARRLCRRGRRAAPDSSKSSATARCGDGRWTLTTNCDWSGPCAPAASPR